MKNSILATILLALGSTAQASSFTITCGNAEGTIKTESGHFANGLQLTKRIYDRENGGHRDEKVELSLRDDVRVEAEDAREIHSEQRNGCDVPNPGQTGGALHRSVYVEKVRITKADGSSFEDGILGVSADRLSVEDFLICERVITNIIPCRK